MKIHFGIIGGAGPEAGAALFMQLVKLCQRSGAQADADFPIITLYSFPFSDMLKPNITEEEKQEIRRQLRDCFEHLQSCDYIVIACNTLHLFLPEEPIFPPDKPRPQLINLMDLTKEKLPEGANPFVIASRTSTSLRLHEKMLGVECEYYDAEQSQELIDLILRGNHPDLTWLLELSKSRPVILGCTEFSAALAHINPDEYPSLIDPLQLAAFRMFKLFKESQKLAPLPSLIFSAKS